jgi:hypothetical protein
MHEFRDNMVEYCEQHFGMYIVVRDVQKTSKFLVDEYNLYSSPIYKKIRPSEHLYSILETLIKLQ